ncbi:MAG: septum formation family protein [Schumannella sp.]
MAATGAPRGETGELSALDVLFGEGQFREYDSRPDPSENPFARRETPPPGADGGFDAPVDKDAPRPGVSRVQKVLLTVLGSLLAVLLLVVLFFLGTRLPGILGPAPAVTAPSASPTPSASAVIAVGPVAPGDYRYDELLGGECLDPFESPWQDRFTVVHCDVPHAAQLVRVGEYPIPETGPEPYPGEDDLQARALTYCQRSGIYSSAVSKLKDAVIGVSYPVSAEAWDAGDRRYSCFVWRSSGEQITADIALPQPTPTPTPAP